MSVRIALAVAACAACASSGNRTENTPKSPPPDAAGTPVASKDAAMNAPTSVDMKFVGLDPGRPPMVRLRFDVTLDNGAAEPRWFLLPKEANRAPASGEGVDGVEVDALGSPPVLVGRFQGSGSIQAVRLPAGGKVTIRRFTIVSFEEVAAGPASLEAVVARDLKVGGEDAAAWFKSDPTTPKSADVSEDGQKRAGSRFTPDRSELPLSFTEEQRVKVDYTVSFH